MRVSSVSIADYTDKFFRSEIIFHLNPIVIQISYELCL